MVALLIQVSINLQQPIKTVNAKTHNYGEMDNALNILRVVPFNCVKRLAPPARLHKAQCGNAARWV